MAATSQRRIGNLSGYAGKQRGCELDSHADTCVAGNNMLLVSDENEKVRVSGFLSNSKPSHVVVGTAVTLYTDASTGDEFNLVFPESLYFGDSVN